MGEQQRVRRSPRMGINALAQYMEAGAGRREAILREQKYPSNYRTIWYELANRAIMRFLLDPDRDPAMLTSAEGRIRELPASDRNEAQKNRDNADAVSAFVACYNDITFDALTVTRGAQQANVIVEGVCGFPEASEGIYEKYITIK